jgi:hypothetical protein
VCGVVGKRRMDVRNLRAGKSSPRSEAARLRFDWPRWLQACHFMGKVAGDRVTASSIGLCPFGRNHILVRV